ncbi:hypothetical protein C7821_10269 [Streptomyces sp. VMFN-G11Ma]|jgi:hypothetical protein|nr:hypothetical protein C7821_10269 [Streptomyces sp. VMFN-G11Ma]
MLSRPPNKSESGRAVAYATGKTPLTRYGNGYVRPLNASFSRENSPC